MAAVEDDLLGRSWLKQAIVLVWWQWRTDLDADAIIVYADDCQRCVCCGQRAQVNEEVAAMRYVWMYSSVFKALVVGSLHIEFVYPTLMIVLGQK